MHVSCVLVRSIPRRSGNSTVSEGSIENLIYVVDDDDDIYCAYSTFLLTCASSCHYAYFLFNIDEFSECSSQDIIVPIVSRQ